MNCGEVIFEYGGRFTSRGNWIHPERIIDTYEWIVMTEGEAYIEEDGNVYELSEGSVLLLEPHKKHRGIRVSCNRVSFYWIHFKAQNFPSVAKCFSLQNRFEVYLLCRQILHYRERREPKSVCGNLLSVLLHEMEWQSSSDPDPNSALVSRVREWIRINIDQNPDAVDVAQYFGYHADYLSRVFRRFYGHGLKAEIDACKCREIKRLLMESDLTLYEISKRVGISDYKLFLKFFKYHEGMTPTEFRNLYPSFHTNNR